HGDLVAFELHPGAAAIAEPAAGQLVCDFFGRQTDPGDHAFQHGHQRPAVRFTSSSPSQHVSHLPTMLPTSPKASGWSQAVTSAAGFSRPESELLQHTQKDAAVVG